MARLRFVGRSGQKFKWKRYVSRKKNRPQSPDQDHLDPKLKFLEKVHSGLKHFCQIAGEESDEENFLGFTDDDIEKVVKKSSHLLNTDNRPLKENDEVNSVQESAEEVTGRLRLRAKSTSMAFFSRFIKRTRRNIESTQKFSKKYQTEDSTEKMTQDGTKQQKSMKGHFKIKFLLGKRFFGKKNEVKKSLKRSEGTDSPVKRKRKRTESVSEEETQKKTPSKKLKEKLLQETKSEDKVVIKRRRKNLDEDVKYKLVDSKRIIPKGWNKVDVAKTKKLIARTQNTNKLKSKKNGGSSSLECSPEIKTSSVNIKYKSLTKVKTKATDESGDKKKISKKLFKNIKYNKLHSSTTHDDIKLLNNSCSSSFLSNSMNFSPNLMLSEAKKVPVFEAPLICDSKRVRKPNVKLIEKWSEDYDLSQKKVEDHRRSIDSLTSTPDNVCIKDKRKSESNKESSASNCVADHKTPVNRTKSKDRHSIISAEENVQMDTAVNCCIICGGAALNCYFGSDQYCCISCAKFYKNISELFVQGKTNIVCPGSGNCLIDYRTADAKCRACIFQKCVRILPDPMTVSSIPDPFETETVLSNVKANRSVSKSSKCSSSAVKLKVENEPKKVKIESAPDLTSEIKPPAAVIKNSGMKSPRPKEMSDKKKRQSSELIQRAEDETIDLLKSDCPSYFALDAGKASQSLQKSSSTEKQSNKVAAIAAATAVVAAAVADAESTDERKDETETEIKTEDAPENDGFKSSGPRIKHVCRREAVALGKPLAVFPPPSELRLSALPSGDKERMLHPEEENSQGSMDSAGTEQQNAVVDESKISHIKRKLSTVKKLKKVKTFKRAKRCHQCDRCLMPDCGKCRACRDMPKFGGRGAQKQACEFRACLNPVLPLNYQPKITKNFERKETPGDESIGDNEMNQVPRTVKKSLILKSRQAAKILKSMKMEGSKLFMKKVGQSKSGWKSKLSKSDSMLTRRMERLKSINAASIEKQKKVMKQVEKVVVNQAPVVQKSVTAEPTKPTEYLLKLAEQKNEFDIEVAWERGVPLIFSQLSNVRTVCRLCASLGQQELVYCNVCCEPFHMYCLEERDRPKPGCLDSWSCLKCQYCHVCFGQSNLLQCDKCQESYHPECLDPYYPTKPSRKKRIWICSKCVRCKSCGSTTPGPDRDDTWTHDFTLCNPCGHLTDKGNYCPVCHKCYTDDDWESQMIQCCTCCSWVHSKCEELTDEMYQIVSNMPEDIPFNCRVCCPEQPSPWRQMIDQELRAGMKSMLDAVLNCSSLPLLRLMKEEEENQSDVTNDLDKTQLDLNKNARLSDEPGSQLEIDGAETQLDNISGSPEKVETSTNSAYKLSNSDDLSSSKDLKPSNEELKPSNEELKLSNEELKLSNEELKLGNEELKLGNEELKPSNDVATCENELNVDQTDDQRNNEDGGNFQMRLKSLFLYKPYVKSDQQRLLFPLDLESVQTKINENKYPTIVELMTDLTRIINYFADNDGKTDESLAGACKAVKDSLNKQIKRSFPWFDLRKSSKSKSKDRGDGLDDACVPPSEDHTYAIWREKDKLPEPEQPVLFRKIDNKSLNSGSLGRLQMFDGNELGSVSSMMSGLNACDGENPDGRTCILCWGVADSPDEDCGRLLYMGQNDWVHANCALWTAEVYEEMDGMLQKVHTAVARGRKLRCDVCAKPGATVGCCQAGCTANFHFLCAKRKNCSFLESKKVFCSAHHQSVDGRFISEFGIHRRVYVGTEGNRLVKRQWANGLSPAAVSVLVGSLTVEFLGRLTSLSDCKSALLPVDFCSSRVFWSTIDARCRTVYNCRIIEVIPKTKAPEVTNDVTIVHDVNDPRYDLSLVMKFCKKVKDENFADDSTISASEEEDDIDISECESLEDVTTTNLPSMLPPSIQPANHSPAASSSAQHSGPGLRFYAQHTNVRLSSSSPNISMDRKLDGHPQTLSLSATTMKMLGMKNSSSDVGKTRDVVKHEDDDLALVQIVDRLNQAAARNQERIRKPSRDSGSGDDSSSIVRNILDNREATERKQITNIVPAGTPGTSLFYVRPRSFLSGHGNDGVAASAPSNNVVTYKVIVQSPSNSSNIKRIPQTDGPAEDSDSDLDDSSRKLSSSKILNDEKLDISMRSTAIMNHPEDLDVVTDNSVLDSGHNNVVSAEMNGEGSLVKDPTRTDLDILQKFGKKCCPRVVLNDIKKSISTPDASKIRMLNLGDDQVTGSRLPSVHESVDQTELRDRPSHMKSSVDVLVHRSDVDAESPGVRSIEDPLQSVEVQSHLVESRNEAQKTNITELERSPTIDGHLNDAIDRVKPSSDVESQSMQLSTTSSELSSIPSDNKKLLDSGVGNSSSIDEQTSIIENKLTLPSTEPSTEFSMETSTEFPMETSTQSKTEFPMETSTASLTKFPMVSSTDSCFVSSAENLKSGVVSTRTDLDTLPQETSPDENRSSSISANHESNLDDKSVNSDSRQSASVMKSDRLQNLMAFKINDDKMKRNFSQLVARNDGDVNKAGKEFGRSSKRPLPEDDLAKSSKKLRTGQNRDGSSAISHKPEKIKPDLIRKNYRLRESCVDYAKLASGDNDDDDDDDDSEPEFIATKTTKKTFDHREHSFKMVDGRDQLVKKKGYGHDPMVKRMFNVRDQLVKKKTDHHFKRPVDSRDQHIQRSIDSRDQHFNRPFDNRDHHFKRPIESPDQHFKRLAVDSRDHHFKRLAVDSRDHHFKRPGDHRDRHFDRPLDKRPADVRTVDSHDHSKKFDLPAAEDRSYNPVRTGSKVLTDSSNHRLYKHNDMDRSGPHEKRKKEPLFELHSMMHSHLPEAELEEEIENCPEIDTDDHLMQDEAQLKKHVPHLMFEITSDDGFHIISDSLNKAWRAVTDKVQDARSQAGLKPVSFVGLSGLYMCGLNHPAVVYLLEQLPGCNRRFRNYDFKYHKDKQESIEDEPVENPHGCARSEPYFRTSNKYDMFSFLLSKYRQPPQADPVITRDEDHLANASQRRSTSLDLPMAMRFRHLRTFAKEAVGVYPSGIHGRGLFCKRDLDAGEMIIEYSGEVVRAILSDKREHCYDGRGIGCYMFRKDSDYVIDSTMMGNASRFINHSCDPNCYSKVIQVDNRKHIVIFASHAIKRGEELTYDYKFPIEEVKIPCTCGSRRCRKYLN